MKNKISNTAEYIATDIRLVALAKQKLTPRVKQEEDKFTEGESKNQQDKQAQS